MQQTPINYTKTSLIREGLMEYYLSQTGLSDSDSKEGKGNSDNGASSKNLGSNSAPRGHGGRPMGISKSFKMRVPTRRQTKQISHQSSIKGRNQPTPEKGHGVPTPSPFTSTTINPNIPSPTFLGHIITLEKSIGDALLLGTSLVGTAKAAISTNY